MKKLILAITIILTLTGTAQAHMGLSLGTAVGKTNALHSSSFKNATREGDLHQYWIGYSFTAQLGLELNYAAFDFDGTGSEHQSYAVAGVYHFLSQYMIHPLAKLGVGQTESKDIFDVKKSSLHAQLSLGLEVDFLQYFSAGGLFNLLNVAEVQSQFKDTILYAPAIYLVVRWK